MTLWVVVFSILVAAHFAGCAERKEVRPASAAREATPANRGAVEDSERVAATPVPFGETEIRRRSSGGG